MYRNNDICVKYLNGGIYMQEKINQQGTSIKNKYTTFFLPLLRLVLDYSAIISAGFIAYEFRNFFVPNGGILHISWLNFYVIWPLIYLLFMQLNELYIKRMQFWKVVSRIFKTNLYAIVTIIVLMYFTNIAGSTSRLFLLLLGVLSFVFLVLFRWLAKKAINHFQILKIPVLLIGAGKTASLVLEKFNQDNELRYDFIGYLEDNIPEERVANMIPYLGEFEDAERIIKETGVQHAMVIAPGLRDETIQAIVYRIQPLVKSISFIPDLGNMPLAVLDMETLIDGRIVAFKIRNNLALWYDRALKHFFDYICTTLGVICLLPFFAIISIWIYKDSPGPIIFKHNRVGKNGKEFPCYKFRSMCVDSKEKLAELLEKSPEARAEWEKDFKLKDDPRITSSGAFLRKTSLDELPQLFNVLKGEMSIVGPRPIVRDEEPKYGKFIADYYMVLPGITGLWQTSGRSDIDYDERVQMDSWYVRNWNVWFDIVLIWRTVKVVLGGKGAY